MSDLIQIKVECHSGHRADEYPKYFYWDEIRFEIIEIIDRWYQGYQNPEIASAKYFKVKTGDNRIYILQHLEYSDKWFLLIHGESLNL
ncbi:cytoplasmic protein [Prolixibacteraceae bacterium Z1-6]|uniref:Cytoplasmic protein n=1 Tax=Draconibacterium aestuarii TaxID=2998507 RepID=A0A9X3F8P2_9BACT|nr:cytoplasmic protein [Prolixibacteraceae bacterium Z1-6]